MTNAAPVAAHTLLERLTSTPLVALLDIDGTLVPLAPRPDLVVIPESTRTIISSLIRLPGVHVAAVTGRSVGDARRLLRVDSIGLIGNHGFEVVGEDGEVTIDPRVHAARPSMRAAAGRIAQVTANIPGAFVEDKVWTLSAHYRLAERSAVPVLSEAVNRVAEEFGLVVTPGKEAFEVRPPVEINKGTASIEFVKAVGGSAKGSILYVGDDRTDEDAFQAIRAAFSDAVTIRVGELDDAMETSAEFRLETPADVLSFLVALTTLRQSRPLD